MLQKIQAAGNYFLMKDAGNYLLNNEKLVFNFMYYVTGFYGGQNSQTQNTLSPEIPKVELAILIK